jgi:hypothetical protein
MKIPVEFRGEIKEILYDTIDHDLISNQTWRNDRGYARSNENDWYMHHYIMGKPPPGYVIDHIDHNGLNNTRQNLRFSRKTIEKFIEGINEIKTKKEEHKSKEIIRNEKAQAVIHWFFIGFRGQDIHRKIEKCGEVA